MDEVGKDRAQNSYEFSCKANEEEIRSMLMQIKFNSVSFIGNVVIVHTPLEVNAFDLLNAVQNAKIPLTYFRDTSQSTKQFF